MLGEACISISSNTLCERMIKTSDHHHRQFVWVTFATLCFPLLSPSLILILVHINVMPGEHCDVYPPGGINCKRRPVILNLKLLVSLRMEQGLLAPCQWQKPTLCPSQINMVK